MKKTLFSWPILSALFATLASGICGRALWCDEILRINGQHYTIDQLFAFKHLHDFCTQTPTGYLFMRPFQLLFGYETGGYVVTVLSAAIITAATLAIVRKLNGGREPHWSVAALVASNPLLCYYGSELSFYPMWSAAFAAALALWINDRNKAGFAAAAALFVTFHFAGIFIWLGVAAVLFLLELRRRSIRESIRLGTLLAVPAAVNLPMYIGAQDKAVHLGTQITNWNKITGLPSELFAYIRELLPSLTGGWILGVLVFAIGATVLLKNRETRKHALLLSASVFAIVLFLSYSALHEYVPHVTRYWIYALAPTLAITAIGLESIRRKKPRLGSAIALVLLAANAIGLSALVTAQGRTSPYRSFIRALENREGHEAVVYPNHYESRFFGGYYQLPKDDYKLIPAYWEQGHDVRVAGLSAIHRIAPLSPAYCTGEDQLAETAAAGWNTNLVCSAKRNWITHLSKTLSVYPEPSTVACDPAILITPDESSFIADAEKAAQVALLPDKNFTIRQMPPQRNNQPFRPFLALDAQQRGSIRLYAPTTWKGESYELRLLIGSDKTCAATIGGTRESLQTQFRNCTRKIAIKPGEWKHVDFSSETGLLAVMPL